MTPRERALSIVHELFPSGGDARLLNGSENYVEAKIEQAVAAQREADCKAICPYCDEPDHFEAATSDGNGWHHKAKSNGRFIWCKAALIRRGAKEEKHG